MADIQNRLYGEERAQENAWQAKAAESEAGRWEMSRFEHEKPSAVEVSERKLGEIAAYRAWLFFRVIGGFSYKDKVMSEMAWEAFAGWLGDACLIDPGKNATSMWDG